MLKKISKNNHLKKLENKIIVSTFVLSNRKY